MKRITTAGLAALASLTAHAQVPLIASGFEPIVVTATRAPGGAVRTLRDAVVIGRDEIESSGALTLAELLQSRAGIEIRQVGGPGQSPTGLFIRGAGAAQTLVLVDGLRVGSATAGTTALEAIPLELVERIEVVKGAMSSLYGSEAIGGVVQVFTRRKDVPHLFAAASYGTDNDRRASAGLSTVDAGTEMSLSLGARKVDAPSATNPRVPFGVHDPDRDPHENLFVSARLARTLWQGEKIAFEGFASSSRTRFDGGSPDDRLEQRLGGARIMSSNQFSPGWKSQFVLGHGKDEQRFTGGFPGRFETRQDQGSWIHELATRSGTLIVGAEALRQRVLPDRDASGAPLYARSTRETLSGFAAVNETIGAQRFEASVRYDDDEQFGSRTTGSASVAMPLFAGGGTQVAATWARGFRAPTFNDLYLTFPGYTANPLLRPEKSESREVSLRGGPWGPISRWRITGFDNRLEDLIVFSFTAGTPLNVSRARVRGVEATFEARWLTLDWRANATVQRPKDEATGLRLQNRAERFGSLDASRRWGAWTAGLTVTASGDRFDSQSESPASRLPSYARVDARLRYDISKLWKAELSAVNLGDERYETALGYDAPRRGVLLTLRLDAF